MLYLRRFGARFFNPARVSMPEVKTPLIHLAPGTVHTAGEEDYIITENHTLADILRFCVQHAGNDTNEIKAILEHL